MTKPRKKAAARVLRAYWELRDPRIRIRHVVAGMGYSNEAPLASDVSLVTGRTPSQLRQLSTNDLLNTIVDSLISESVATPCEAAAPTALVAKAG